MGQFSELHKLSRSFFGGVVFSLYICTATDVDLQWRIIYDAPCRALNVSSDRNQRDDGTTSIYHS